ncbi:MAG: hypothetical protein K9N47_28525 [Prosthecobacter sp.]|uniref:hypothetical protein n=1 Tax=Prosthecobacter sp. TaxID=1965333 RepID=UPI00261AC07B|nr:hypothetical protein [Prosthecobacter sp.]MCF7790097.1 hypothetical protein [Prosthecobacter sp.]
MSAGFFTGTYHVPHPRLNVRWIGAVHLALVRAFELIRADGFDLTNASEDGITFKLEQTFENRLLPADDEDLDLSFIRSVTRESALANHDESSIGRKPDLVFRLNRRELSHTHDRLQDCLFAECKPVDRQHSLRDHYCAVGKKTSGIERFVCGAYASAMEQALMIAYVRDGVQITHHLAESLAVQKTRAGLGEPSTLLCVIAATDQYCQGLHLTTHQRLYSWSDGRPATPIDIYHSWHLC